MFLKLLFLYRNSKKCRLALFFEIWFFTRIFGSIYQYKSNVVWNGFSFHFCIDFNLFYFLLSLIKKDLSKILLPKLYWQNVPDIRYNLDPSFWFFQDFSAFFQDWKKKYQFFRWYLEIKCLLWRDDFHIECRGFPRYDPELQ